MPETYAAAHRYPGKYHRLQDAADVGQLIIVHCSLCRRTVRFLARDLVHLLDPKRDATVPPYPCSKCKKSDYLRVSLHIPEAGDYGHLEVRRPSRIQVRQLWHTVRLGD